MGKEKGRRKEEKGRFNYIIYTIYYVYKLRNKFVEYNIFCIQTEN